MKGCLPPLGIRELHGETTVRHYFTSTRMAKVTKSDYSVSAGWGRTRTPAEMHGVKAILENRWAISQ